MNGNIQSRTRCSNCGRTSVLNGSCAACGFSENRHSEAIIPTRSSSVIGPRSLPLSHFSAGSHPTTARGSITRITSLIADQHRSEISGRVIIVRQSPHEPMDFDPWRWVAIPVWGFLLLIAPIAIAVIVWWSFGFTAAMAVGMVLLLVLRYLFSDRLLQSWYLAAALNGRHIVEPMPVLMLRLRIPDGNEVQVRVKGQLDGGALIEGDRIRATGRWRAGVFRVSRVSCERTGANITPHQPNAYFLALLGMSCLLVTCLWMWLGAYPWVMNEINQFRDSWSQPTTFPTPTFITP
jgi:hypothetical protein